MPLYFIPQFIESETKIIGPFSLSQFGFLGGAGTIIIILFFLTKNLLLTILIGLILGPLALYFAIGTYNGERVFGILIRAFFHFLKSKKYIWIKKGEEGFKAKEIKRIIEEKKEVAERERIKKSKLKELIWEIQTGKKSL